MSADFFLRLGWAVGRVLVPGGGGNVIIGKDTRSSGYMFESALEAGFSAAGVSVQLLGPLPTPAIAYLTRSTDASAGVVISASHNPFYDNGIKFFSADGKKLADETEAAIEQQISMSFETVESANLGYAERMEDAADRYVEFCKASLADGDSISGIKAVLDCANGAAYSIGPRVLRELGAELYAVAVQPDGLNINHNCGSTHLEMIKNELQQHSGAIGIALDGDADRVLMIDENGHVVDGDELLFIIARARQSRNSLVGPVVGTVMTNLGIENAFKEAGLTFARAPVGDRNVLAKLDELGGQLGGEASGHIICLDRTTTGDGLIAAIQVLAEMKARGCRLVDLCSDLHKYPQRLVNVQVRELFQPDSSPDLEKEIAAAEAELSNSGRVVLRASGTESLIRVMVEGKDEKQVVKLAERLAEAVRRTAESRSRATG